jgi:hypothetical protein
MTSTHVRLVVALGLALGVGVVPLVAVEVSVGGVGGAVEVCDGTVRTSLWLNTSWQAIYLRSLELRQVAEFGFEGDVRATAFVRRPGFDELMLAENWNHICASGVIGGILPSAGSMMIEVCLSAVARLRSVHTSWL